MDTMIGADAPPEAMPARAAFQAALRQAWAIEAPALEMILAIAQRVGEGPEALAVRLGRPLRNTQTVTLRDGVAVLPVEGPLFPKANMFTEISGATSTEILARDFRTAMDDPGVRGVVLAISSPGGAAEGISELARHIYDARGEKPIAAYVAGHAASAAYWIASAADTVVVSDTGLVGSIGVVAGVRTGVARDRVEIVSSQSPNKRLDVNTEAGRAEVQRTVDALAQVFVEAVGEFRGVSVATVLSDFGQGGLLVGRDAVAAGMADRVGSLESVIAGIAGGGSEMTIRQGADAGANELAELRTQYEALVETLAQERAEGVAQAEAARAEGVVQGVAQERARILGVAAVFEGHLPAHAALLAECQAEEGLAPEAAAMRLLAALGAARDQRVQDIARDAVHPAPDASGGGAAGAPERDFDALVAEQVAAGRPRAEAIRTVVRTHPEAHQRMIEEQRSRRAV